MITRRSICSRLLLVLLVLCSSNSRFGSCLITAEDLHHHDDHGHHDTFMPKVEKFDAPSLSIRGALKAAFEHDFEDVIVMQTEMAWGAEEMKRYKTIKGAWPVRPSVSDNNNSNGEEDDPFARDRGLFRGRDSKDGPEDGEVDYWSYLISIF